VIDSLRRRPEVPLYEYRCPKCGVFEVIRKFSDEPLTVCPTCGAEIQKLASAPAFHLKGTGWYVTDYAKKSSAGEGKSSEGKASESKSGDSKGSESKSAESKSGEAKSDTKSAKDSGTGAAASTSSKKSD
jgi:putative FmdB family regulatory protein